MRTISLHQPWATLIAIGAKKIETRAWHAGYCGLLAIHAAKRFDRRVLRINAFRDALAAAGLLTATLPAGEVIAVANLAGCMSITSDGLVGGGGARQLPGFPERHFGDYTPGRWAWFLEDVRPLAVPIRCPGRQRWFDVPNDLIDRGLPGGRAGA